ncbi:hypothetical protein BXZ70DRAFT_769292 [Cristinia sonorae]|uniref:Neutral metalloproteinase n=1 Tax=Cristinia sonorae TaxID=1940300 RepID=A0A8K0XSI6_9AGAR|nr:hypothetical protein BXZ70DRAFT_769292 [Cristinia sonorae]
MHQLRKDRINRRLNASQGRGPSRGGGPAGSGIIPDHILSNIASSTIADSRSREAAQRSLGISSAFRAQREAQAASLREQAADPKRLNRRVYSANNTIYYDDTLLRSEGDSATNDVAADECYDGFGATFKFYSDIFDRNSIDDGGLTLIGSVHYGDHWTDARWNGAQMLFGDGDGEYLNRFTACLDVIGHELTHGVTENTAHFVYQGESGALNESMSDVFGIMIKQYQLGQTSAQSDWLIGAGLFTSKVKGAALRSMKDPGTAYDDPVLGKDEQMATYSEVLAHPYADDDDDGGVHVYSGVPNRAFYLVATELGGHSWDRAGRIWWATLTDSQLKPTADFHAFATLTCQHAESLYDGSVKAVVEQAWKDVGIEVGITRAPDPQTPSKTVAGTWLGTHNRSRFECTFDVSGETLTGWGSITDADDGRNSPFTIINGYYGPMGRILFDVQFKSSNTSNEKCTGIMTASGEAISGTWENADRAEYLKVGWPDNEILSGSFNLSRTSLTLHIGMHLTAGLLCDSCVAS